MYTDTTVMAYSNSLVCGCLPLKAHRSVLWLICQQLLANSRPCGGYHLTSGLVGIVYRPLLSTADLLVDLRVEFELELELLPPDDDMKGNLLLIRCISTLLVICQL